MTEPSLRSRGVFPALDGLRIVAVAAVVATHSAFWTGRYTQGPGRAVLAHLDVGVPIFFVISGFLISREWLAVDRDTGGLPRLRGYAWRRALRILPMYWLTVVVVLLAVPGNRDAGAGDWLRQLVLLQAYGADNLAAGLTQTWSLCTEVSFYAVLPGLAWAIIRMAGSRARVPMVTLVVAAVLTICSLWWVAFVHTNGAGALASAGYWLPTTLGWFLAGTALAAVRLAADRPGSSPRWRRLDALGDAPGVCVTVALAAFAIAVTPLAGDQLDPLPSAGQAVAKNVLYLVVGLALVVPAVLGDGRAYDPVLGHPVMRYLGRISYSVFLVHLALLQGIAAVLGDPIFTGSFGVTYVLTLAASVALAAVAYRVVERPALRWAHRGPRAHRIAAPTAGVSW